MVSVRQAATQRSAYLISLKGTKPQGGVLIPGASRSQAVRFDVPLASRIVAVCRFDRALTAHGGEVDRVTAGRAGVRCSQRTLRDTAGPFRLRPWRVGYGPGLLRERGRALDPGCVASANASESGSRGLAALLDRVRPEQRPPPGSGLRPAVREAVGSLARVHPSASRWSTVSVGRDLRVPRRRGGLSHTAADVARGGHPDAFARWSRVGSMGPGPWELPRLRPWRSVGSGRNEPNRVGLRVPHARAGQPASRLGCTLVARPVRSRIVPSRGETWDWPLRSHSEAAPKDREGSRPLRKR